MFASAASALSTPVRADADFARAVAEGLTRRRQKTLPPSWFYDDVGSALFETITLLPEYGLTRTEGRLLDRASGEIVRASRQPDLIVELGSGTGTKTRFLLAAAAQAGPVEYRPIDISSAALDSCAKVLGGMDRVRIEPIDATYLDGIDVAMAGRKHGQRVLLLFLGSTIGNFNRGEAVLFLRRIRKHMQPGDCLLLGADLVKPQAKLLSAYNDSIGVTAAFNLNILARINRELDGNFNIPSFAHEARYNERLARIEMHLRSRVTQKVEIGAIDTTVLFSAGETIWTESSHKFRTEEVVQMGKRAGWSSMRQWVDCEWGFAETLFQICRPTSSVPTSSVPTSSVPTSSVPTSSVAK
jgi:L-histidine Nalpha-methyltransferase